MACFLVPAGEAVITTIVQKVTEKREKDSEEKEGKGKKTSAPKLEWSRRLSWLNKMLWGGSILLAFEHVWHGEIVPWPPFLTAMEYPADIAPMLQELATYGTAMALTITAVWGIMVLVAELKYRTMPEVKTESVSGGN